MAHAARTAHRQIGQGGPGRTASGSWHNGHMGAATLVSLEEYLSTSYEPVCDYVDGDLEDRNVGKKTTVVFAPSRPRADQRVPDICVTLGEPEEQVFAGAPFLCVEILSPEDRAGRIQRKIADYLKFGVRYIWVIDPRERDAVIYTASGTQVVADGILPTSDPDIAVPLAEILG